MIRKYWQIFVLWGIAFGLFLIPLLFWGDLYIVGGDDARLYYLYPLEYLKNFSFNVMSGNTLGGNLGYMPVSFSAPAIALIAILKKLLPLVNTQLFVYGFIFSLGFLFFYYFLQELISKKTPYYFWISIVASLSYIASPYIGRTYFQSQFISIFILMVLPGFLWFFIAGMKRKNASLVIASSLLYSVFSSTVLSFPWFLPTVITLIPLFIYLARQYGRYFWKMTGIFTGIFFVCNVYWIIHFFIMRVYKSNGASYISSLVSDRFIQQNNDLIGALVHLNSPVHQMMQYLRTSWQDRMGATPIQSIGLLFLSVIVVAGVLLRKVKREMRVLYLVASTGLLLAMFFVTPNFGLWNTQLFQFLNAHVPFFVIFRNMYDKFALAMTFNYAFALWVSLAVLGEAKIKRIFVYVLVLVVLSITLIRAVPFIHSVYKETGDSTRISGLNQDYMGLTRYIQSLDTSSRFVWYPMTFGDYVYISDSNNPNHYYVGVSPLQIFARASDLAGFYGLQTPGDPELNWHVLDLLQQKNFTEVGNVFKRLNVGYVIVNNEKVPQGVPFVLEQFDFVKYQNEQYKQTILGEKIRDFGKRYSLYTLNSQFRSPTVFLTDGEITFHKNIDATYDVGPFTVSKQEQLILMEPYSGLWHIRVTGINGQETISNKQKIINTPSQLAYGYGNAWLLDPDTIGSTPLYVRAEFWPNNLIVPSIIISIAGGAIALLYCVIMWPRKNKPL